MSLYDSLRNKSIVADVNEIFYDKVYEHPWLSQFFADVRIEHIKAQQTDFIVGLIGGPKLYCGRPVHSAHPNILITEELFDTRSALLIEALDEAGAPEELKTKWLRIDEGFRRGMVKTSVDECEKRWNSDQIKAFEPPAGVSRIG